MEGREWEEGERKGETAWLVGRKISYFKLNTPKEEFASCSLCIFLTIGTLCYEKKMLSVLKE